MITIKNLRVAFVIFIVLALSSTGFAGVTRSVCMSNVRNLKICVQDPNGLYFIPLKSDDRRYELKEIEPYRLYANEGFSLDYEHMKLTDLTTQENFDLKCGKVKPGMCGWTF